MAANVDITPTAEDTRRLCFLDLASEIQLNIFSQYFADVSVKLRRSLRVGEQHAPAFDNCLAPLFLTKELRQLANLAFFRNAKFFLNQYNCLDKTWNQPALSYQTRRLQRKSCWRSQDVRHLSVQLSELRCLIDTDYRPGNVPVLGQNAFHRDSTPNEYLCGLNPFDPAPNTPTLPILRLLKSVQTLTIRLECISYKRPDHLSAVRRGIYDWFRTATTRRRLDTDVLLASLRKNYPFELIVRLDIQIRDANPYLLVPGNPHPSEGWDDWENYQATICGNDIHVVTDSPTPRESEKYIRQALKLDPDGAFTSQPATQDFCEEEILVLHKLYHQTYDDLLMAGCFRHVSLPADFTPMMAESLLRKFNGTFTGRIMEGSKWPRRARKWRQLVDEAARHPERFKEFGRQKMVDAISRDELHRHWGDKCSLRRKPL
jgi:hypothetical protein